MWKSCSKCGRIHQQGFKCYRDKDKNETDKLRNTYRWRKKREAIKDRSAYLCAVCREQGRYNYKDIEVHHINKLRAAPSRLLDDDNLICLCREHHEQADSGKLTKEYLLSLVEKRES